mmetsp:Transcript_21712/g.47328  ORF Transcript_21712/g.47328 Transcript_21712/m.47328 type:complete len:428 (+) Transcript_21712:227-1510(+)
MASSKSLLDEEGDADSEFTSLKAGRSFFVDYIPPPVKSHPPPAKYKYTAVIIAHVYVMASFIAEAGIIDAMVATGLINFHFARFWAFYLEIAVIIYLSQDPLNYVARFKWRGKWYGIVTWMKQPRHTWLKKYDNFFAQFLYLLVHIAEDGFAMFNPPPRPVATEKTKANVTGGGRSVGNVDGSDNNDDDGDDDESEVVLHIKHRIRQDKLAEYERWKLMMVKFMKTQPGYLRFEEGEIIGDMHDVQLVFSSHETLREYMASPARARLYQKVESLIVAPSTMQLKTRQDPGALTEMLSLQGQPEAARPPKKWKVCWIVTVALNFAALIWDAVMPFYYEAWGMDEQSVWLQRLVQFCILVPLIVFVISPMLLMLFSEWVRRKEHEFDTNQPWKALNDGLPLWLQTTGLLLFFAGTGTAWTLRAQEGSNG